MQTRGGGGPKFRKLCRRHLSMAPSQVNTRALGSYNLLLFTFEKQCALNYYETRGRRSFLVQLLFKKAALIQCCTALPMCILCILYILHQIHTGQISALGHCMGTQPNISIIVHEWKRFYDSLTNHWRNPCQKYFDLLIHFVDLLYQVFKSVEDNAALELWPAIEGLSTRSPNFALK